MTGWTGPIRKPTVIDQYLSPECSTNKGKRLLIVFAIYISWSFRDRDCGGNYFEKSIVTHPRLNGGNLFYKLMWNHS